MIFTMNLKCASNELRDLQIQSVVSQRKYRKAPIPHLVIWSNVPLKCSDVILKGVYKGKRVVI